MPKISKKCSESKFDLEKYYDRIEIYHDSTNNTSNIVHTPFMLCEHIEESLKEYNEFMLEYKSNHKYCPNCGSESYSTTLIGFPLYSNRKDEYKNKNHCCCTDCGLKHIVHDRIKTKNDYAKNK